MQAKLPTFDRFPVSSRAFFTPLGQARATRPVVAALSTELKRKNRLSANTPVGPHQRKGCFHKWWYPQIIHFNRVFLYKSSILGYPYFWKPLSLVCLWLNVVAPASRAQSCQCGGAREMPNKAIVLKFFVWNESGKCFFLEKPLRFKFQLFEVESPHWFEEILYESVWYL